MFLKKYAVRSGLIRNFLNLVFCFKQVVTYNGFYDSNLEWVGLEGVQIVASMNAGTSLGRHKLTPRFTSVVRICCIGYVLDFFILNCNDTVMIMVSEGA